MTRQIQVYTQSLKRVRCPRTLWNSDLSLVGKRDRTKSREGHEREKEEEEEEVEEEEEEEKRRRKQKHTSQPNR
jgi:hypothetical protein